MRAPEQSSRRRARLLRAALDEYSDAVEKFAASCLTLLEWELHEREAAARSTSPRGEVAEATPRQTERRRLARQTAQNRIGKSLSDPIGKPPPPQQRVLELVVS